MPYKITTGRVVDLILLVCSKFREIQIFHLVSFAFWTYCALQAIHYKICVFTIGPHIFIDQTSILIF